MWRCTSGWMAGQIFLWFDPTFITRFSITRGSTRIKLRCPKRNVCSVAISTNSWQEHRLLTQEPPIVPQKTSINPRCSPSFRRYVDETSPQSDMQTDCKLSILLQFELHQQIAYRGADKSLARPTSRCILFDGGNISFDGRLVLYIYIYIYIQGVTGGTDQTSGECSLC